MNFYKINIMQSMEFNNFMFNNNKINIILDKNNEPWFKAKDVANILEYSNTKQAIRKCVDEEDRKKLIDIKTLSNELTYNEKNTIYINKTGFCSLIISSKKEKAKMVKKILIEEILPSINKYNKNNKEIDDMIEDLSSQLNICKNQLLINKELESQILHEIDRINS